MNLCRISRAAMALLLAVCAVLVWLFADMVPPARAADPAKGYGLKPRSIAADTWVLEGRPEDFSLDNGGHIVNTAFVVTREGVVVIDTGPSRQYGEEQRKAIATVTKQPVRRVFITHHHPDHWFGNQAYQDVPIAALPATLAAMKEEGGNFADNLYRMAGDWMKGTEPLPAGETVTQESYRLGGREFRLLPLAGHTAGDLAILDTATGVLFAGDLVFYDRAPTTPHANLARWRQSLDVLERTPFTAMLPGHGPVLPDARGIRQTRAWLGWLETALQGAAGRGLDMPEVMRLPIPAEFKSMELARTELERSVVHLYPAMERAVLEGGPGR